MYREYPAPEALAGLVECFWRSEFTEPGADTSGVVLPDGRVDVIWPAGGPTLVAGPQKRFLPRPLQAPFVAIRTRFYPGVGPPLLGLPAHELVDMHVALTEIDTRPAGALNDQLAALADPGLAVGKLGGALAELADGAGALDPLPPRRARHDGRPRRERGGTEREAARAPLSRVGGLRAQDAAADSALPPLPLRAGEGTRKLGRPREDRRRDRLFGSGPSDPREP